MFREPLEALCTPLSIAMLALLPVRAPAQGVVPGRSGPEIVASASGEAQLAPDRAAVYIGVQTRSSTAAAAARDNAQRQTAIINAVIAAGVPREQISTENYSVSPDTRYDQQTQRATVTGYIVSNVVRAEVRRTDQIAPVLDAALGKGGASAGGCGGDGSSSEWLVRRAAGADLGGNRPASDVQDVNGGAARRHSGAHTDRARAADSASERDSPLAVPTRLSALTAKCSDIMQRYWRY
jgi:hypothetical protein